MPDPRGSARLLGTPVSRDMQTRTVSAMSETPSLSADERAELEWRRSEVATLPTIWPRWPFGGRVESVNGSCPLTDGGIEDFA